MKIIIENSIYSKVDRELQPIVKQLLSFRKEYWKQDQYAKERVEYDSSMLKRGEVLTGLVPKIVDHLKKKNINFTIEGYNEKLKPTNKPCIEGITFREDQLRLIESAIDNQRGLIISPTGSGKTVIAAGLISCFKNSKVLFLMHTIDLLHQTVSEFKKFGLNNISIIGDGKKDLTGDIIVATRQTLANIDVKKYYDIFDITIVDECFHKNTKVLTNNKSKKIKDVKINDIVLTHKGLCKVLKVIKNKVDLSQIIRIDLSSGKKIYCTKDHLFMTIDHKWLPAKEIKGEFLLSKQNKYDMMQAIILIKEGLSNGRNKKIDSVLSWLQKNINKKIQKSKILLKRMFPQRSNTKQTIIRMDDKIKSYEKRRNKEKNVKQQSYAQFKNSGKNDEYKKNKWDIKHMSSCSWWKWKIYRTSNFIINCFRMAHGNSSSISSTNKKREEKRISEKRKLPYLLQSRYWKQKIKNWYRSRWKSPPIKRENKKRQKERKEVKSIRVENIEIYKRGSNDQSFSSIIGSKERDQNFIEFYDLEIEKNHCYFVENVLAHNCHHCNAVDSQYGKIFTNNLSIMKIGFTATEQKTKEKALSLEGLIGPVIGELSLEEGIERGILCKPKVKLINIPYKPTDTRQYYALYKEQIINSRTRNRIIIKEVKKRIVKNKSCLVIVKEIEHGNNLMEIAKTLNLKDIIFIQGNTEGEQRQEVKRLLQNKKIKAVIVTAIWTEGLNIPSLDCVINAFGGKSEIKTLQAIGRGLRTFKGKEGMEIVDFLDGHRYLAEHCIRRLQIYVENKWL